MVDILKYLLFLVRQVTARSHNEPNALSCSVIRTKIFYGDMVRRHSMTQSPAFSSLKTASTIKKSGMK